LLENQVKLFQEIETYLAEQMGMPTPPAMTVAPAAVDEEPAVQFKLDN